MDFSSVHNVHEEAVYEAVAAMAPQYPAMADAADAADLLADVACVALNRMQPRYIRHAADLAFFTTAKERTATERDIRESVDFAFGYVQARHAMAARR